MWCNTVVAAALFATITTAATPHFKLRALNSTSTLASSTTSALSDLLSSTSSGATSTSDASAQTDSSETLSTVTSSLDSTTSTTSFTNSATTSLTDSATTSFTDSATTSLTDSATTSFTDSATASSNGTSLLSSSSLSSSLSTSNATSLITTNASTTEPAVCTGCVLEAISPTTFSYTAKPSETWVPITVTETILTVLVTYFDSSTIDTIVTEYTTLNQTSTVYGPANQTIVHTTPVFTWAPSFNTTLTFAAGATYVAYTNILGGLDYPPETTEGTMTNMLPTATQSNVCYATESRIWIYPGSPEEYSFYIETFKDGAPTPAPSGPVSLPPALISHLKGNPEISSIFNGSDIATCSYRPTNTLPEPLQSTSFEAPPPVASSPFPSVMPSQTTQTYISKTYESTSTHVTRQGCLRCSPQVIPPVGPTYNIQNPSHGPNNPSPQLPRPNDPQQTNNPQPPRPNDPQQTNPQPPRPNNPQHTNNPQPPNPSQGPQQRPNIPEVTIGDSVFQVRPADPTGQQTGPNQQNPGIVIGSETLTPGQTTTMNGVVVVVPTQGGGSSLVVDGSTIGVNPVPTGPPVLTVGDSTTTANSQGQFVVGTQTLTPGGSAITVDGSVLSLGPSGTIAVVNGVTQTLGNVPFATGAPVITVGSQTVSATVIGGTTQFVLAPGQTLTPGGVLTIDGTTYSMPSGGSGSTVVVNGVTSTLNAPGVPVLTLGNGQSITASIVGGKTAFVVGPGQTLTPGGVITVSGTTFSMPSSASGSVIVINGVTSTLGQSPITSAPALTINGKTYSASVRDGTTEYVLGPGTTLRPGEAVTVSGTTYSLDPSGTALIINGKTSSMPSTPASNSATTTKSGSKSGTMSRSSSASTGASSSTSSRRDPGDFIASGIGISSKGGAAVVRGSSFDKAVEGMIIGVAGWLMMLL